MFNKSVGFPGSSVVKILSANTGDPGEAGSISGLRQSPEGGDGKPLQYFCLENPIDREESGRLQSIGLQKVRHN